MLSALRVFIISFLRTYCLIFSAAAGKNAFLGPFKLELAMVTTLFKGMPPIVS